MKNFYNENIYENIFINGKIFYFFKYNKLPYNLILDPLIYTNNINNFYIKIKVYGGGYMSQIISIRYGIAKTLLKFNKNLKNILYSYKLLSRDARKVERKKLGFCKSRKKKQFSKR